MLTLFRPRAAGVCEYPVFSIGCAGGTDGEKFLPAQALAETEVRLAEDAGEMPLFIPS